MVNVPKDAAVQIAKKTAMARQEYMRQKHMTPAHRRSSTGQAEQDGLIKLLFEALSVFERHMKGGVAPDREIDYVAIADAVVRMADVDGCCLKDTSERERVTGDVLGMMRISLEPHERKRLHAVVAKRVIGL